MLRRGIRKHLCSGAEQRGAFRARETLRRWKIQEKKFLLEQRSPRYYLPSWSLEESLICTFLVKFNFPHVSPISVGTH